MIVNPILIGVRDGLWKGVRMEIAQVSSEDGTSLLNGHPWWKCLREWVIRGTRLWSGVLRVAMKFLLMKEMSWYESSIIVWRVLTHWTLFCFKLKFVFLIITVYVVSGWSLGNSRRLMEQTEKWNRDVESRQEIMRTRCSTKTLLFLGKIAMLYSTVMTLRPWRNGMTKKNNDKVLVQWRNDDEYDNRETGEGVSQAERKGIGAVRLHTQVWQAFEYVPSIKFYRILFIDVV